MSQQDKKLGNGYVYDVVRVGHFTVESVHVVYRSDFSENIVKRPSAPLGRNAYMTGSVRSSPPKPVRIWNSCTDTRKKQIAAPTFFVVASPKGSTPTIDPSTAHVGEGPPGFLHPSETVQLLILEEGFPSRDRSIGCHPICFGSIVRTCTYH